MYGTQTSLAVEPSVATFENDVEMYGTQTRMIQLADRMPFENDVEMYGTQTFADLNDIFL